MAGTTTPVESDHGELPEAVIEALARLWAEVLVLEYRRKLSPDAADDGCSVNSPTGIHRPPQSLSRAAPNDGDG